MVLVAPRPLQRTAAPGDAVADRGTGAEVLALLRGDAAARPRFDPGLAGGLRAWLEDAAYDVVAARGEHAAPLFLGPRQLLGSHDELGDHGYDRGAGAARGGPTEGLALTRLVHSLLRQLVHTGEIQEPLADALDALRANGNETEAREIESLPAAARTVLSETLAIHARNLSGLVPRFAPGWMPRTNDRVAIPLAGGRIVLHGIFDLVVGLPQQRTASLCALGLSTSGPWAVARRSLHYLSLLETLRTGTPPFRLALLESASGRYGVEDVREEHLRALASHIAAWLDPGRDRSHPRRARIMDGRLMDALLAPVPAVDATSWRSTLEETKSKLAGLAVRRAGAVRFRVTDHEVRTAFTTDIGAAKPFAWSALTARRSIGVAAVRLLLGGTARSPLEAVRCRMAESSRWAQDGSSSATQLDRWIDGLSPAGRAAVGAEAVTWATRLWCALDWSSFPSAPVVGRDHWWDSPHSALLALRGRADVRSANAHLVVLSGPRRGSVRAELALVTLVEALRLQGEDVPGRVIGWWPDSGHLVRVDPEPAVLTLGTEAVELALGGAGTSLRSAA